MLRRQSKKEVNSILSYGGIKIDKERRTVISQDEEIILTFKEFELLILLMENRGKVVPRERILENVWGWNFEGESRTVDMHIKTLRQKLGQNGINIETVRGVGYKLGG